MSIFPPYIHLSSQNFLIFSHNFYDITVREYLSYSTSPLSSLQEYYVGVCYLNVLSDKPIYAFTVNSLKGLMTYEVYQLFRDT